MNTWPSSDRACCLGRKHSKDITVWHENNLRGLHLNKDIYTKGDWTKTWLSWTPWSRIYSCHDSRWFCCSIGSIFNLLDCDLFQWYYNCYFCCVCVCVRVCTRMLSHLVVNGSLWPHESVAYQVPLSMRILQERVLEWGCHFLLQGAFLTQGSNPHLLCLLNWQVDSLQLCHLGKLGLLISLKLIRASLPKKYCILSLPY